MRWRETREADDPSATDHRNTPSVEQLRAAAADRIVRETLERDKVVMEVAAKTIFRRGNVQ